MIVSPLSVKPSLLSDRVNEPESLEITTEPEFWPSTKSAAEVEPLFVQYKVADPTLVVVTV